MVNKTHVTAIVGLIAIVWAVTLWIRGVPFTWQDAGPLTAPFGIAVSILYASLIAFDRWLWKMPFLRPWFVKRPMLSGTWRATLVSSYVDPSTGQGAGSIYGFWVVRQTNSTIYIRLFTEKSASFSLSAEIVGRQTGLSVLATVYQNEPRARYRNITSEIHYGAAYVELVGLPPKTLAGHYWTDRKTFGEMSFIDRRRRHVNSFQEGAALYMEGRPALWRVWKWRYR